MPAFYPRAQASSHPLTPPDSGSAGYGYSNMNYSQEPYVPYQNLGSSRHETSYDHQHSYMQPAVAPAPPTYQFQAGSFQPSNSLPPISSYYEPMGAPILPPLRIQEHMSFTDDYARRLQEEQRSAILREQQRQVAKEEKATGGVCAKLDYEMERMTDFVTHYTQKMYGLHQSPICLADIDMIRSFNQTVTSPPAFRKWVHQVLSATRLPSTTILLSLHYLSERFKLYPDSIKNSENQIYRLLAVSLILGSKFLDDNTFVNKSWSDVTAIKVSELNVLEREWLHLINYHLHVDLNGGVESWIDAWKQYDAEQTANRLSPLDTNLHRQSVNRDRHSPYPSPYSAAPSSRYDTPLSAQSSQYANTPYSSGDPWSSSRSNYDEFYKQREHRYPTLTDIDEANRRASQERARQSQYSYQQPAAPQSYYQPSAYGNSWDSYGWNGMHRSDCTCSSCVYQHYRPYSMATSYSAQSVMG